MEETIAVDIYHREKFSQLAACHSELEQTETKTQAALVTILALTQVTELKLLLDVGPSGHTYYAFVLTLLVSSIIVEILLGIVIIYIGNLQHYRLSDVIFWSWDSIACLECRSTTRNDHRFQDVDRQNFPKRRLSNEELDLVIENLSHGRPIVPWSCFGSNLSSDFSADKSEVDLEVARIKMEEVEVKLVSMRNAVASVEEGIRRCPTNPQLREELMRRREELNSAIKEKDETESKWRNAETEIRRTLFLKKKEEEDAALVIFRTVCYWQRRATYLLYFVMLMNVFITAFGISGSHRVLITAPNNVQNQIVIPGAFYPLRYRLNATNNSA